MDTVNIFPAVLNRAAAPEVIGPQGAVVLDNVRLDIPSGRLLRRLGLSKTNIPSSVTNVTACGVMTRRDGTVIVFDASLAGDIRATVNPVAQWSNADAFGGRGSAEWNENFEW